MSIKDYFRSKQTAEQSERAQCLADLKSSVQRYADIAHNELPAIEGELLTADSWIRDNLSIVPSREWPDSLQRLVFDLEGPRGNPGMLRQALKEFDSLTEADARESRADGEKDINRSAVVRESFRYRLNCANGCANSIKRTLERIKAEAAKLEQWLDYQKAISAKGVKPVVILEPQKRPEADKPTVMKDFDARRVD